MSNPALSAPKPQPLSPSPTLTLELPNPLGCPECGTTTPLDDEITRCGECDRLLAVTGACYCAELDPRDVQGGHACDVCRASCELRALKSTSAPPPPRPAPSASHFAGCLSCDDLGAVACGYDPSTGQSWSSPGAAVRRSESTSPCGDAYEHPTCIGCGELIERGDLALDCALHGEWRGLHTRIECVDRCLRDCADYLEDDDLRADLVMRVVHALLRAERQREAKRHAA